MSPTGVISAIVIGIVVGVLGRLVVPGRQRISVLLTILLGIGAALLGTWLANYFNVGTTAGIDWIEIAIQVGLAAVAVALVSGVASRRSV